MVSTNLVNIHQGYGAVVVLQFPWTHSIKPAILIMHFIQCNAAFNIQCFYLWMTGVIKKYEGYLMLIHFFVSTRFGQQVIASLTFRIICCQFRSVVLGGEMFKWRTVQCVYFRKCSCVSVCVTFKNAHFQFAQYESWFMCAVLWPYSGSYRSCRSTTFSELYFSNTKTLFSSSPDINYDFIFLVFPLLLSVKLIEIRIEMGTIFSWNRVDHLLVREELKDE
jgi:hypothetical protein